MNNSPISYRIYLRDVLLEKKRINPQYSLRSFARTLGIEPTFLSYILSGKRGISDRMIAQFIVKLGLDTQEAKIFELLVKFEKAEHHSIKEKILAELKVADPLRSQHRDLSIENFSLISQWHHYVIFMLIDIDDFEWTLPNVANAVGIDRLEVKRALERLEALDLISFTEKERPVKLEERILATGNQTSTAIQKYHLQMLRKTEVAIENLPTKTRFNASEVLILSQDQVAEASDILEECYRKIFALSKKKSKTKEVFQMGIHLFPLTQLKKELRSKK